jgi:hypothetical protein
MAQDGQEDFIPSIQEIPSPPASRATTQQTTPIRPLTPEEIFFSDLDSRLESQNPPRDFQQSEQDFFDHINGYLPVGDRLRSLFGVIDQVNPVSGVRRSMQDSAEGDWIGMATELASLPIPAAITARLVNTVAREGAEIVPQAVNQVLNRPRAVIRPDDTYRGEGVIRTSVRANETSPYATRTTAQSQIDDMIRTGVVRPPEGGYQGEAIMYFGSNDSPIPTSIMNRPNSSKPYTIVTAGDTVAGREGPISLDEVLHIWTYRDGELVDILDDVLTQNRNYSGYYEGGLVTSGPAGSPLTREMREGGEQRTFPSQPTENFIPQREEPPAPPATTLNYYTPEEAFTRFSQYLPIEATPNDLLVPSDDPRVYTYQMANGNIYQVPAYQEVLAERRTIGEAFRHAVDQIPSRTEGIAINIGALRDQYNLQYPRFSDGGLVTQTRSAFGGMK